MTEEVITTSVATEAINTETAATAATATTGTPMGFKFNGKELLKVGAYGLLMGATVAIGQYIVVKVVNYIEDPTEQKKRETRKVERQQKRAERKAKREEKKAAKKGVILENPVEETN